MMIIEPTSVHDISFFLYLLWIYIPTYVVFHCLFCQYRYIRKRLRLNIYNDYKNRFRLMIMSFYTYMLWILNRLRFMIKILYLYRICKPSLVTFYVYYINIFIYMTTTVTKNSSSWYYLFSHNLTDSYDFTIDNLENSCNFGPNACAKNSLDEQKYVLFSSPCSHNNPHYSLQYDPGGHPSRWRWPHRFWLRSAWRDIISYFCTSLQSGCIPMASFIPTSQMDNYNKRCQGIKM